MNISESACYIQLYDAKIVDLRRFFSVFNINGQPPIRSYSLTPYILAVYVPFSVPVELVFCL